MTVKRNIKIAELAFRLAGKKCIVCGYDLKNNQGSRMTETAHLQPFSQAYNDTIQNIIPLCSLHHTEFDCCEFYIDPETRVFKWRDTTNKYHNQKPIGNINHISKYYLYARKDYYEKGVRV